MKVIKFIYHVLLRVSLIPLFMITAVFMIMYLPMSLLTSIFFGEAFDDFVDKLGEDHWFTRITMYLPYLVMNTIIHIEDTTKWRKDDN